MHKQTVDRYHHMTCDICGKTETIKEENPMMVFDFWTRHWSKVQFNQFPEYKPGNVTVLDLCPTCTRKFKKLVKMTEVEEDV